MKKNFGVIVGIVIIASLLSTGQCFAKLGGQVFFRGSWAQLESNREGDALVSSNNIGNDGWGVGAGLHLPLAVDPFLKNDIMGEIMLAYYRFGKDPSGTTTEDSMFTALIGPRYRIHLAEPGTPLGRIQPFVGVGMLFGVISPPSNNVSYLDIGVQPSIGVDYTLPGFNDTLSIGMDYRYSYFAQDVNRNDNFQTAGVYLGINF